MSALKTLAKMLGVGSHNAEDALHSERAAKAALSRRNLFAAAGAMAAGAVFCPPLPVALSSQVHVERFTIYFNGKQVGEAVSVATWALGDSWIRVAEVSP